MEKITFLSTLSLRRATPSPRSGRIRHNISIHALLAESDGYFARNAAAIRKFLSTLSLRRATNEQRQKDAHYYISIHALLAESDQAANDTDNTTSISIHALLAESDRDSGQDDGKARRFLSTLSLRRATAPNRRPYHCNRNFYPRSPCGERLVQNQIVFHHNLFLSTLSLRRATPRKTEVPGAIEISIHALLAESDDKC